MFMRTKFFVAAAALCLTAFTACSDNEVLKPEVGGDNTYLFNEEGKGYIRLSLDVPVETRAISTNDDGDLNEYKVNNIYLLIFSGANEADAKFTSAYDLTSNFTKNGQAEITSTAEIIKEINKEGVGSTDNLYAYVMLNKPASLTFSGNSITLGAVTSYSNGSFQTPASTEGMTFSAFKTLVINNQADETYFRSNGFFMGNSPLSDKNDADASTAQVTTLRKIEANSIYPSQAAAEQGNASTKIYVERAVAKVTLTADAVNTGDKTFDSNNKKFKYEVVGWMLDNTAKQEYITRNVDNFGEYRTYRSNATVNPQVDANSRMLENGMLDGASSLYRINFAEAPTYALNVDNQTDTYFNVNKDVTKVKNWNKVTTASEINPAYCLENTYNVANMKDYHSTRVIVKVQLKDDKGANLNTFFTRSDKGNLLYASEDEVKSNLRTDVWNWDYVQAWLKEHNNEATKVEPDDFFANYTAVFTNNKTNPQVELKADGWSTSTSDNTTIQQLQDKINADLKKITIRKYDSGLTYYPVIIRHFKDTETPWKPEWVPANSVNAYELANNGEGKQSAINYLGRYGVVRNTWYEINVNTISKLGDSGIPELPTTDGKWNDSVERYLKVEIHTVKWQKRTQNTDL